MINVFNIERFATHDGPGIRSVVFLKGCPLHCPWCANPESWSTKPQLMYTKSKCISCNACVKNCPTLAITFENGEFKYNQNLCIACKACEHTCLQDAIEIVGKQMHVNEVMDILMKDIDYYQNSNGGITISGGEPFVQFDSLFSLVKACKQKGLHIAIETTGFTSLENIKAIAPYVDLFLYDVKHTNHSILQQTTGAKLSTILDNLIYLSKNNNVIIRMPIIPNFNYDNHTIHEVIEIASSLHIQEVHLLPYHTLGKSKWDKMLKQYYSNEKMLSKEDLIPYIEYGKQIQVEVKIGG